MKPKMYDDFGNSIKYEIPPPSIKILDKSKILTTAIRMEIINIAAKCVSENNLFGLGRAPMCLQFAILVKYMLGKKIINVSLVEGKAEYFTYSQSFAWKHYWLETDSNELIDCNIDSIIYHPDCPANIEPYNYWGDISEMPIDRKYTNKIYLTEKDLHKIESQDNEIIKWKKEIDDIFLK
jgi:hypothetical protein